MGPYPLSSSAAATDAPAASNCDGLGVVVLRREHQRRAAEVVARVDGALRLGLEEGAEAVDVAAGGGAPDGVLHDRQRANFHAAAGVATRATGRPMPAVGRPRHSSPASKLNR